MLLKYICFGIYFFKLIVLIKCEKDVMLYTTNTNNNEIKVHEISNSVNFTIEKNWIAKCIYKNDINNTGFAYIEIKTNSNASDSEQAFHAGYLEGNVSSDLIYSQWYNTVNDFRTTMNKSIVKEVEIFLKSNSKWISRQFHHKNDSYWHQLQLVYLQIQGIYRGYNAVSKNYLQWNDILWLSVFYDLTDLYSALGGTEVEGDGHCSVLIKILPGYKDIYFGHNSWTYYQTMLRMQKKYSLNYKKTLNTTKKIPGYEISFSSYPGSIASMDDYYLISSGLATTETTNEVFNKSLWNNIKPENIVLGNIRAVVANRLASDGETWSNIFKLYNSGTYNNQWMILDFKKFKTGQPPSAGTFWVLEQIPKKVVANDLTQVLINKGYWSSYNIPYYKDIYELTGYKEKYLQFGNWFSHEGAPRARIFSRDQVDVTDMISFMNLMRSNDYQHDPFAHCKCNPPYSASGAIAARSDLNPVNGTYEFKAQSHRPTGATDAKITNFGLFLKLRFIGIAGPTTGTGGILPIFKWSTSNFTSTPHMSHPDVWNFKPVLHKWTFGH
ncbi:putative phospholipase B-like 2 [Lycorma delicatula]|uniref:putative phospholipase B-like 2 n=1 Tax=Lycorma delicatula TaxID=130591 RepID=UPI003F50D76D